MMKIYETENYIYFTDGETNQLKDLMVQPDEYLNISLQNYDIYKIQNIKTQQISYVLVDSNDELVSICNKLPEITTIINEIKWQKNEQNNKI